MRRLSDLLPGVASQLGFEAELQLALAMSSWERLVAEHVPAAAGATTLLEVRPPELVVSAADASTSQELRLRAAELLLAFASAPGGARLLELRVVLRPGHRPGPTGGCTGRPV